MSQMIADVMTSDVRVVDSQHSLQDAAELMRKLDVGALPVVSGRQLAGMITDRDIAVRAVARGLGADTPVAQVMSSQVQACQQTQSVPEVMAMMGDLQLRRLPVVDPQGLLVGIVSLGDLATRQNLDVDEVVRDISQPAAAQVV
jgi:CBS domain-containing protein